jgi:cellulose synthase operon protein C
LRMAARQKVARGKYDEAQRDLQSALVATRNPVTDLREDQKVKRNSAASADPVTPLPAASPALPACRSTISDNAPGNLKPMSTRSPGRARLINAAWVQSSSDGQSTASAQSQSSAPAQSPTPAPGQDRRPDSTQEGRIQDEIDVVQNRNTPFSGFGDAVTGRTGDPGFGRLIIEDGALSDSITYANKVRFAIEAHGVYLFSGSPNGGSALPFGTLTQGTLFGEQKEFGLAGEGQLSTNTFGLAFGTSPQGFPIHNLVGGMRFRPANGPLTFMFERDSIRDSLLSYAGARDPGTGQVWGGVVSNTGSLQLSHDVRGTGQYVTLNYGFIQGTNVPDNWKVGGSAGVYLRVVKGLSLGLAASGMHYDKNLSFFSLGQGGYFSPQQYYVASIPISWFARHRRFEYQIRAGLGVQYVSEDSSPFFPTQPQLSPNFYSSQVHTGPNYNVEVRVGYRIAPRWYLDLYGAGNNAQNFATQTIGFNLKFLMHRLPTDTDLHVKSIPDWKGRQPFGIE